ncbi:preprotein translocase, YajC subunit [Xylanimonas cellulosilytica DSM 15894]|uniref:Preprotein translocase, YajC subunit n=1 Tax=Xylanimonas cellulosilytica (strain DSM 15894 / JCM 12276 / CECT 5975 / KCTC 9989 / LMG 20990 / NBRC 107835 / XIL07) TaxID=446471 RepID=D1BSK0_XYLCX|nr:preprotein translocase subunit YajC [Xylanimonas cellulosilytica]ACZ30692.1 preprotein translocase, YajC subunit [Xylanimonas cellulosilytica DSM 15894]
MEFIILIVAMLGLMFFMSSRQRKQQKAQQEFRNELAAGQEVMTASGLFGTIVEIDDANDRITLDSAGSRSVWLRAAIAKRVDSPVSDLVTEESVEAGTIAPAEAVDVPDDISGLDTAQREYREKRNKDDEGK